MGVVWQQNNVTKFTLTIVVTSDSTSLKQFFKKAVTVSYLYTLEATLIYKLTGIIPDNLPKKENIEKLDN
ncbi:MAG: hypothetical protein JJP05_09025 [cyanobacterium endosymbiont of Rhopalodia gibba]